jgi:hypothetical protein
MEFLDHNVLLVDHIVKDHILVDILDKMDNVDHNGHNDDHNHDGHDDHNDHMAIDIVVDDVE